MSEIPEPDQAPYVAGDQGNALAAMALPVACIFCRRDFGVGVRRSEEHIWPRWMHPLLPGGAGAQHRRAGSRPVQSRKFGRVLYRHFKPRVVCADCNNGWMSRCEKNLKPILEPLVRGEVLQLGVADQCRLATWAAMKNMVAEHSDPASIATDEQDRIRMFERQLPPQRATIWVGSHASGLWGAKYLHHELRITHGVVRPTGEPPANALIATFGVGHLIIQTAVFPADFMFGGEPIPIGPISRRIRRIHPNPEPLDWPLAEELSERDALDLGQRMCEAQANLIRRPPAEALEVLAREAKAAGLSLEEAKDGL